MATFRADISNLVSGVVGRLLVDDSELNPESGRPANKNKQFNVDGV